MGVEVLALVDQDVPVVEVPRVMVWAVTHVPFADHRRAISRCPELADEGGL